MWILHTPVEETVLSELASPSGRYVAITSTRGAGATTSSSYHIEIVECVGNKRVSLGEPFGSDSEFSIIWQEDKKLLIAIHYPSKDIFTQKEMVGGVAIEYLPESQ